MSLLPGRFKRLYNFDLLRLSLVLLALISHFKLSQDWHHLISDEAWVHLTAITRSAMPCLLIVFGFMIEYVYVKKWKTKGAKVVLSKMLYRTVLCYLAFVTLAFVGYLAGHNSLYSLLTSFVLIGSAQHADLFKYYALLIPATFCLLWIRFKYGELVRVIVIIVAVLMVESLNLIFQSYAISFGHIGGMLFGFGDKVGPSVVHALMLLAFGGAVANCTATKTGPTPMQLRLLALVVLLSFGIIAVEISSVGWADFESEVARYSGYRAHNSYIYFAYGIAVFSVFWGLSKLIVARLNNSSKERITYYGGDTFTIFYYGNLIILLTPPLSNNLFVSLIGLAITLYLAVNSIRALKWAKEHVRLVRFISNQIDNLAKLISKIIWVLYPGQVKQRNKSMAAAETKKREKEREREEVVHF